METYGLSDQILFDLHEIFLRFPEVESVLIYGSRAKGTHRPESDVDLAVVAPNITPERFTQLWSLIDDSPIIYKLDVLHWNKLTNRRLKKQIDATGRPFYPQVTNSAFSRVLETLSFGRLREMIYNRFHDPLDQRFNRHICESDDHNIPDRYAAYYTSMYLLADCYEATQEIVDSGFAKNPYRGYIETWGFLQALFISQDSLSELYRAVTFGKLDTEGLGTWRQVRECRNEIAGHPANRQGRYRSFFGRRHHELKRFQYERFDSKTHQIDHPVIDLEKLRGDYFETDAAAVLRTIVLHIDTEIRR